SQFIRRSRATGRASAPALRHAKSFDPKSYLAPQFAFAPRPLRRRRYVLKPNVGAQRLRWVLVARTPCYAEGVVYLFAQFEVSAVKSKFQNRKSKPAPHVHLCKTPFPGCQGAVPCSLLLHPRPSLTLSTNTPPARSPRFSQKQLPPFPTIPS